MENQNSYTTAMKFSDALTHFRERKGLNKTDLAKKIGVKPEYIVGIEKGRFKPPTADRLEQMSIVLGLDDREKKKLFELAQEERMNSDDLAFQQITGNAPKPIEVKPTRIPVVALAKGSDMEGFEFEQLQPHEYEYIDFKGCKGLRINGNSMAPLAYHNQRVIYSEEEEIHDGDLVFIKLKKRGEFFKRYHKDAKNGIITLISINIASHAPIVAKREEVEFMFKVVGVKF